MTSDDVIMFSCCENSDTHTIICTQTLEDQSLELYIPFPPLGVLRGYSPPYMADHSYQHLYAKVEFVCIPTESMECNMNW